VSRSARAALRLRSRPLQISSLGTVLVVAPHPDDETLGCGGTLALLARAGKTVNVAFVTDGSASHPRHSRFSANEIAALRRDEARIATGILGVGWNRLFFVEATDGTLATLGPESSSGIVAKMAEILAATAPDAVLVTYRNDGSTDHNASVALLLKALQHTVPRPQILEFPIWAWRNPLLLLRPILSTRTVWRNDISSVLKLKSDALGAYVSQTYPIPPDSLPILSPEFTAEFILGEEFFFEK
jgi:N-acetylglucosamine malate deacetylase 1